MRLPASTNKLNPAGIAKYHIRLSKNFVNGFLYAYNMVRLIGVIVSCDGELRLYDLERHIDI